MKSIILLSVLSLLNYSLCFCQHLLKGKVVDEQSGYPVELMNIAISDQATGTVTNENGEFTVSVEALPAVLVYSHINYTKKEVRIEEANQVITIKATPVVITLPEVVVGNFVDTLIKRAYEKAEELHEKRYTGKAFYRAKTKQNDDFIELHEVFYETELSTSGVEKYKIEQARYAKKETKGMEISFKNVSEVSLQFPVFQKNADKLMFPVIKDVASYYTTEIVSFINDGKQEIAVIKVTPKPGTGKICMYGQVYIDVNTYDIVKIEGKMNGLMQGKMRSHELKNSVVNFEVAFKPHQDFNSVLDYIKVEGNVDVFKKEALVKKVEVSSVLFFYDYHPESLSGAYSKVKGEKDDLAEIKKSAYNKEFWQNNPVIQRTPVEEEVIRSFEAEGAFGNMIEQKK